MKSTMILVVMAASMGLVLACGGGSEQPPATSEATTESPAPPVETPPVEPPPAAPETSAGTDQADSGGAAPAAAAPEGTEDKGPERTVIHSEGSKKNAVNFEHWAHQKHADKCEQCHHDDKKSCGAEGCHSRVKEKAPTKQTAFHNTCMPCHKKAKVHKGCNDCHPKS